MVLRQFLPLAVAPAWVLQLRKHRPTPTIGEEGSTGTRSRRSPCRSIAHSPIRPTGNIAQHVPRTSCLLTPSGRWSRLLAWPVARSTAWAIAGRLLAVLLAHVAADEGVPGFLPFPPSTRTRSGHTRLAQMSTLDEAPADASVDVAAERKSARQTACGVSDRSRFKSAINRRLYGGGRSSRPNPADDGHPVVIRPGRWKRPSRSSFALTPHHRQRPRSRRVGSGIKQG
jgi:hypothetical protein